MLELYLLICIDRLYVYEKNMNIQSFDGNPYFKYEPSKVAPAVDGLIAALVENNNLSGVDELRFLLVESSEQVRNEVVAGKLADNLIRRYPLTEAIERAITDMGRDKKNHMELGLNYDGHSYNIEQGIIKEKEFDLLSLTIEPSVLLKYVA